MNYVFHLESIKYLANENWSKILESRNRYLCRQISATVHKNVILNKAIFDVTNQNKRTFNRPKDERTESETLGSAKFC